MIKVLKKWVTLELKDWGICFNKNKECFTKYNSFDFWILWYFSEVLSYTTIWKQNNNYRKYINFDKSNFIKFLNTWKTFNDNVTAISSDWSKIYTWMEIGRTTSQKTSLNNTDSYMFANFNSSYPHVHPVCHNGWCRNLPDWNWTRQTRNDTNWQQKWWDFNLIFVR